MKKYYFLTILCIATALSAAAKAGDRFEWHPDRNDIYINYATIVCEIISEEDKTCKIVEIIPTDYNLPIRVIDTPDLTRYPQSGYNGYRITEICPHAFDNPYFGREVWHIRVHNIPVVGDFAFFGSTKPYMTDDDIPQTYVVLEKVKKIGEYAFANSEIDVMDVDSMTPPEVHINTFSDLTYSRCTVYIPYLTWDVYHEHPVWGRFKKLQCAFDGVNYIEPDEVSYHISGNELTVCGAPEGVIIRLYDMTGRCVDSIEYHSNTTNSLTAPNAGIYILHYNGKAHKILIKP